MDTSIISINPENYQINSLADRPFIKKGKFILIFISALVVMYLLYIFINEGVSEIEVAILIVGVLGIFNPFIVRLIDKLNIEKSKSMAIADILSKKEKEFITSGYNKLGERIFFNEHSNIFFLEYNFHELKVILKSFSKEEIVSINLEIVPDELRYYFKKNSSYTVGGALVGGIPGLIVGTLIDSVFGKNKGRRLNQSIDFKLEANFQLTNGNNINEILYSTCFGYNMLEGDFVYETKKTFKKMNNIIFNLNDFFSTKVNISSMSKDEFRNFISQLELEEKASQYSLHEFNKDGTICIHCGSSKNAIENFGWKCTYFGNN